MEHSTTVGGQYATAIIYTDDVEEEAVKQVRDYCNSQVAQDSNPRLMPDIHAGKGCTIGFTAKLTDCVVPDLIGADIGCGVLGSRLDFMPASDEHFFAGLDAYIRKNIPYGFNSHSKCAFNQCELKVLFEQTSMAKDVDLKSYLKLLEESADRVQARPLNALGSLGGGNHFIEVDRDQDGFLWVVVHTGSRNYGLQVGKYHNKFTQIRKYDFNKAFGQIEQNGKVEIEVCQVAEFKNYIVQQLNAQGRQKQIAEYLSKVVSYHRQASLAFLVDKNKDAYIHDMKIAQAFAQMNRAAILMRIKQFCAQYARENDVKQAAASETVESVHNYIDFSDNIIRKGAISARAGERVIIPLNMRDGTVIGVGKGNDEWNQSAPHGSGRKMSRSQAKKVLTIQDYKDKMKHVWSTSVTQDTIDEAPDAYKDSETIIEYLKDTVQVTHRLQSVYNFKAGKDERDL